MDFFDFANIPESLKLRKALEKFEDHHKELLLSNIIEISFKKGENVFKQSSPASHVGLIKSGLLKVCVTEKQNRNLILKLAGHGEFIGITSSYGNSTHRYTSVAVENAEMVLIDKVVFQKLLIQYPDFFIEIMKLLSNNELFILNRFTSLTQKQIPGRIAHALLYFSNNIFKSDEFVLPFSRQEFSEFISTSKESLIRTLSEFKNDRIIDLKTKSIKINSKPLLEKLNLLG